MSVQVLDFVRRVLAGQGQGEGQGPSAPEAFREDCSTPRSLQGSAGGLRAG